MVIPRVSSVSCQVSVNNCHVSVSDMLVMAGWMLAHLYVNGA